MTTPLLDAKAVHKTYKLGKTKVPVLRGVDLRVDAGEWVAVLGASGSGKSTLMHLLGALDTPDRKSGASIAFDGTLLAAMGAFGRDLYRTRDVGFVFQFYHLLPELTVMQNVTIGSMIATGRVRWMSGEKREAEDRARALLETFGLGHRLGHRPGELSGGERQRVAVARALINEPRLLLADEPTGNLDSETGGAIVDTLSGLRSSMGLTIVMVTHDSSMAARADRVVRLSGGRVEPDDGSVSVGGTAGGSAGSA